MYAEVADRWREMPAAVRRVSGRDVTTFCIGGELALVEPQSQKELQEVVRYCGQQGVKYRVLGNGSNLLIADEGVPELVIRLGRAFRAVEAVGAAGWRVGGGASLMSVSRDLSQAGFSGLEFAGGIPASLGGAVCMNAGAHGGEMAQVIRSVHCILSNGEYEELPASALQFAYRHSSLPAGAIVVGAHIELCAGDAARISAQRTHFLAERKLRQPLAMPSAGSIFRNPSASVTAGALIERAGLKGSCEGGACISSLHANWIVNAERRATAVEVRALIARCQREVSVQSRVDLHPELVQWGVR